MVTAWDAAGLIVEGQAMVGLLEANGPDVDIPESIPISIESGGGVWEAFMEKDGYRAVIHIAKRLQPLQEALEADKTFGPAAGRYYRLWRTMIGHEYGSDAYQSGIERERDGLRRSGALLSLLSLNYKIGG